MKNIVILLDEIHKSCERKSISWHALLILSSLQALPPGVYDIVADITSSLGVSNQACEFGLVKFEEDSIHHTSNSGPTHANVFSIKHYFVRCSRSDLRRPTIYYYLRKLHSYLSLSYATESVVFVHRRS
jgi:hypothetical protein